MSTLSERLALLPQIHRETLEWFHERRGQLTPRPEPVHGVHVFNPQTGIQKPAGWAHAVSIRQTLSSDYEDSSPVVAPDGSWTYSYYQERKDPDQAARIATNRALFANRDDDIPVAVMIQEKPKPGVQYRIWGLAKVVGFSDGYFHLQGYNDFGELPATEAPEADTAYLAPQTDYSGVAELWAPIDFEDSRRRIEQQIYVRQGGGAFRASALHNFGGRCAISDCDVAAVLEAAHIVPYLGAHTNAADNALLLRADIHSLFDQHLLSINPDTLTVELSESIEHTSYAELAGRSIYIPGGSSPETLRRRLLERDAKLHGEALTAS
ncbi:MAG: HNH endonuclease [Brevundimonas sp.]